MGIKCFYVEQDGDEWVRRDTGDRQRAPRQFGPGAIWDAPWMGAKPDGHYYVCVLPDGREWSMDAQASNCTRKGEDHDCWCRHGEPPELNVNKVPEPGRSTCQAGAGSIGSIKPGGWHGFLRHGYLMDASEPGAFE